MKKIFSGKRAKLRRIASKTPKTRPIGQAKGRDNVRIIPIKIHLKFQIEPEDQRVQYVELLNMMINKLQHIINNRRTKTTQRLRAMQLLTNLIQTSYTIVRDVDIEALEEEIEAVEETMNKTS
ncbi:MAG: hypothetical protein NWF13_06745 [Candidatus Bathyarchaeota archaeon]|nr:hypothetical protein [Candidatus Bathyarchaeota archaeon]